MDEIEKIHLKNRALIKARNYLRDQSPTDIVAISHITESIVDLTGRHLAATDAQKVQKVGLRQQQELDKAIEALVKNVAKKAPASQILKDAKIVYGLKPWPPSPTTDDRFATRSWKVPLPLTYKALSRVGATRPYPPKR